jgi:predicted amidohydrolase
MHSPDETSTAKEQPGTLRVAMAQVAPVLGDLPRNLAMHLEQIEAARRQHADAVIFPELSLTGYFVHARASQGVFAHLRTFRRAAILRRRQPDYGVRHGTIRPGWNFDL